MARTMGRLTARKVQNVKEGIEAGRPQTPGMHCDGGGLYLQITPNGASWIFRFAALDGRRTREMGLGPLHTFTLAEAREEARKARQLRHKGTDPIEDRKARRLQAQLDAAKAMTFKQCADAYISAHRKGWRSAKHAGQWETTLATYAYPIIGALPVAAVDTGLVLKVLEPIWSSRPETASRLRGRIERILDWAKARVYRDGENPARWRGHLEHQLPARSKVSMIEHYAALPYAEVPAFMADLRRREGITPRALEFAILTAARVGEVIGAKWSEFNLLDKVWIIPSSRMKAGREHRVPLSVAALAVLEQMQAHRHGDDGLVFPGGKDGEPLRNSVMWDLRKSMGRTDITAHGFRSSFSDWAHERTGHDNIVIEQSLAHAVGSAVERAYRRTDLFEKRRRLMDAWASFCTTAPVERGAVVAMQRR
jgi:integrase